VALMTDREKKLVRLIIRGCIFKNRVTFAEWCAAIDELGL
jgi:hypothetical protein